jgi:hypothetical protein
MSSNAVKLSAWRDHKVFVIGGGSLLPLLVDTVRIHPDRREPLSVMPLEQRQPERPAYRAICSPPMAQHPNARIKAKLLSDWGIHYHGVATTEFFGCRLRQVSDRRVPLEMAERVSGPRREKCFAVNTASD